MSMGASIVTYTVDAAHAEDLHPCQGTWAAPVLDSEPRPLPVQADRRCMAARRRIRGSVPTMATTKLMTAADVMLLEGHGYRYELIEGELERMSPANLEHAWTGNWFGWRISDHVDAHRLGAVFDSSAGYFFGHNPDTLLEPDVSFIRADRLPPGSDWRAFSEVVPDLVVEIISPSERRAHLDRKIAICLAAGVRLIWFVDPRRRAITVFAPAREPVVLDETNELDGGDILPGFCITVADCFPRLPH